MLRYGSKLVKVGHFGVIALSESTDMTERARLWGEPTDLQLDNSR